MCPVIMSTNIVKRISAYPKTTIDSQINLFTVCARVYELKSPQMVEKLRSAGRLVTEENLGFSVNEIGTHSIRSGAAMSLFLGGVQTFSIMMIGRWSSDAFLKYIRKQVEKFTHNSSKRMLKLESFFTTPNFVPLASSSDTRTRNDRNNFATVRHNGVPNANSRQPFALVS